MKRILYIIIFTLISIAIHAEEKGRWVTVNTVEGVEMQIFIHQSWEHDGNTVAIVGRRESYMTAAIDINTEGTVTVPAEVEGYPVVEIRNYSFRNCSKITKLVLPSTLTSVESNIIQGCTALEEIVMDGTGKYVQCEGNCIISVSYVEEIESGREVKMGCKNSVIPSNITSIGDKAFKDVALKELNLPAGIFDIGESAFSGTQIESVTIPKLEQFSTSASIFADCKNLKSVTFADGLTIIGKEWFSGCSSLTSIVLPSSLFEIGESAFANCEMITQIQFPEALGFINKGAFSNTGLTSVFIPKNVIYCSQAFSDCPLEQIEVDAANPRYDSRNNCNAIIDKANGEYLEYNGYYSQSIYTVNGIKYQNVLIAGCKNTVIPAGVEAIGKDAFRGSGIVSVIMPNSIALVNSGAFAFCKNMTSLTLSESLKSIYDGAFFGCSSLKALHIPASVESIDYNVFYDCSGLESITVAENNANYDSRDNCNALIKKSVEYSTNGEDYRTGAELELGCINTKIPEGIELIADCAFEGIKGLKSIKIPSSIRQIGSAFLDTSLDVVYSFIQEPFDIWGSFTLGWNGDERIYPSTLYVPKGTKEKYLAAEGWNLFKHIIEMDETAIDDVTLISAKTLHIYNLNGQQLSKPRKGINIIDGHKVMVR